MQDDPRQEANRGGYHQRPEHPERTISFPDRDRFRREPEPDPVAPGEPVRPPQDGPWKRAIDEWIARREPGRGDQGRKRRMPRPWLDCTSNFGPQVVALKVGEPGLVSFTVWNKGNYPAWTCYVELYEGPGKYSHPLSDYLLQGREIITLHPGEKREVRLSWTRQQKTARIVGIVYDPLLDPRDFTLVEQFNRHITSVHYSNLE